MLSKNDELSQLPSQLPSQQICRQTVWARQASEGRSGEVIRSAHNRKNDEESDLLP